MDHSRTGQQLTVLQPRLVLLCSLIGAALVGLYLLRYEYVRATVLDAGGTFRYFVPLMVPCFAFMLERTINHPTFAFPTSVVRYKNRLLVVNKCGAEFKKKRGGNPPLRLHLIEGKVRLDLYVRQNLV